MDPNRPPIAADLRHPNDKAELISGTITSQLPVELEEVVLYYSSGATGKWYLIDRLVPDVPQRVDNLLADNTRAKTTQDWIKAPVAPGKAPQVARPNQSGGNSIAVLMKDIMFHQAKGDPQRDNPLRPLDQSWRLHYKDEVLLVGRVARRDGQAEAITNDAASPSQLWLGTLPDAGQPRPQLFGTMSQETYVRAILPVRSADAK
jgi:hypothetical protein